MTDTGNEALRAQFEKYSDIFVLVLDHGASFGIARYEVRVGRENVYNTELEELAQAKAASLRKEINQELQAAYAAGAEAARAEEPVTPLTDVQWDTAPATKRKCGHVTAGQCNQCERCFACCTCCPECNSSRKLQKFNDPNKCRHPHHSEAPPEGKVEQITPFMDVRWKAVASPAMSAEQFWDKYESTAEDGLPWPDQFSFAEAYAAHLTAGKDKEIERLNQEWDEEHSVMEEMLERASKHREKLEAELARLREVQAHVQKWGHGSYACHIAPDKVALERNKSVEAEGERIRSELEDFLKRKRIVGIMMDTDEHVVRIDIAKLPPRIKPVLTLWGSIYVIDDEARAALEPTRQEEK